VDCYSSGATMLHVHVRDPATGHGSLDFDQFNDFIGRLKQAMPKMVLPVSLSPDFYQVRSGTSKLFKLMIRRKNLL
jgi:uncharacterized protein (DUF849 family)